jgi:hypothetical protein
MKSWEVYNDGELITIVHMSSIYGADQVKQILIKDQNYPESIEVKEI